MQRTSHIAEERDFERILKLKECCDMLLAGGYFRARIPTLSPFDKVVGGLAWSITASGVDVDVDVIFQENASIGQKIKTSDQIVRALVLMKCPNPLQSHQIQGLDYDHLFPVIQWLVRKVIETRRLTGDQVRLLSLSQFSKHYTLPEDARKPLVKALVTSTLDAHRPVRLYKKKTGVEFETIEARTEATLLEYGERITGSAAEDEEKEDKKRNQASSGARNALLAKFDPSKGGAAADAKAKAEEEAKRAQEEKEKERFEDMQKQMSDAAALSKVSGANVGSLVGMQADEIKRAATEYEEMKKRQEAEEAEYALAISGKKGAEAAFQRQLEALKRRVAAQDDAYKKRKAAYDEQKGKYDELSKELAKKTAYIERIGRETAKLEAMENQSDNKAMLERLQQLVKLNETLKAQEAEFKASCLEQRQQLLDKLAALQNAEEDAEVKKMLDIEQIYESELNKLNKIRKVLAKKNQEIARMTREIDETPTRAELLQFERRFVELYELVAEKHVETKKYFAMYNTLNDSYGYMQNEVSLLNSIIEQFPNAMKAKNGKESFIESMGNILVGIGKQTDQARAQQSTHVRERDALIAKRDALLEKQRAYFKAVKEFQEACFKNETLLAQLEAQGA